MQNFTRDGRDFRLYEKNDYWPIRRDLSSEGWRSYDVSDGSLAGTEILAAFLVLSDRLGRQNTFLLSRKAN